MLSGIHRDVEYITSPMLSGLHRDVEYITELDAL